MSTESAAPHRESAFTSIALFPLRALERARGWRRLGLLLLYALIALPILAMMCRQSRLAALPDVGDTFDLPAAGTADDRNAFVPYRRAVERSREMSEAEAESFSRANLRWSAADAVLRGWVAAHREAIALLRAGSERPEAYLELPAHPTGPPTLTSKQEVIGRLTWVADAALFEAGRLRARGIRPARGRC